MNGKAIADILGRSRIVAVLVVEDVAVAVPLARALVEGGIGLIEVTLRSAVALDAIAAIVRGVPEAVVGAGTLTAPGQFAEAEERGCRFLVSPGATPALCEAAAQSAVPWLPGAATVSEMLALRERGYLIAEVLSRRGVGRCRLSEVAGFAAARPSFLPDRRHRRTQCPGLPGGSERPVRRRLLDGTAGARQVRRLGRHHRSCGPPVTAAAIVPRAGSSLWRAPHFRRTSRR